MNDLIRYQPQLPANMQRPPSRQNRQMDYIAQLTMQALGEQSAIYSYMMFQVIRTLDNIEALKKAFPGSMMTPQTEAALQDLTHDYLQAMGLIPQQAAQKILLVLQDASDPPDDGGLLRAVIDAIAEYILNRR